MYGGNFLLKCIITIIYGSSERLYATHLSRIDYDVERVEDFVKFF